MKWRASSAVLAFAAAGVLAVGGCTNADTTSRWQCWFNEESADYCVCAFASDQDLADMGYRPGDFPLDTCPSADYLCCQAGASVTSLRDVEACECVNRESVIGCRGEYPLVSRCP